MTPWPKFAALFLIALPFSNQSVADDFEIEMGLATHHWVSDDLYEDNQLIGAGYHGWELATFVNSFGDRSYSAGYRWNGPGWLSVSSGLIHGYGENSNWFPLRVDEEVIYVVLNIEPTTNGPIGARLRVMGEATMLSVVVRPVGARRSLAWNRPPPQSASDHSNLNQPGKASSE